MTSPNLVGIPAFVEHLVRVLEGVDLMGVRWTGTRFQQYLRLLEEASRMTYPCPFPWEGDPERQKLFFESACQCQQLMDAVEVLESAEPNVAAEKLEKIVKGTQLPPADVHVPDAPRNTLFELATAASLRRSGFTVNITRFDEDARAEFRGLLPFLVECKRPAHDGSLLKNLKDARHQLKKRRASGKDYGLAVIGIDRLIGISGEAPVVDTEELFLAAVERTLHGQKRRIEEVQLQTGEKLFPHASIAGVLLVAAVFIRDRGNIFTTSLLRLFCAGPETHRTSVTIKQCMAATIPMTDAL